MLNSVGRAHRNGLTVTVGLGIAGVVGGSTTLMLGGGLTMAAVLLSAQRLLRPKPEAWLHRGVHLVTVLGLVGCLAILSRARIDAVLLIVMLGIFNRFVLRTSPRDDFIVVAASAVLLTMATTVTPGIAFLPLVLCFLPAALWALTTANALSQQRWAPPNGRDQVAAAPVPRLNAALTLGATAFMLVAFAGVSFFPRYNFGRMMAAGSFMNFAGVGASMDMSTGGVSNAVGGQVLLRVEGPDAESEGLYARVYAFDLFDGQVWSQSAPNPLVRFRGIVEGERPPQRKHEVRLRRLVDRGRPHPVAAIGTSRPWAVGLRQPLHGPSGTWLTAVPQASLQIEYAAYSDRRPEHAAKEALERFLTLPAGLDGRLRDLAGQLTEGTSTHREKLARILGHFGQGYQYSLEPLEGASQDPLLRFVFEAKAGHCELYAGAAVVLLRLAGVPARVAAGYYGGWWNARSGSLEYTPDDAHAWVEWWDPERGWTWADATPPSGRTRRSGKSLAWLRDWYDWIEGAWYNHVVDYDETRRRQLLEVLEARFDAGWSGVTGLLSHQTPRSGPTRGGGSVLWVLGTVFVLGLGVLGAFVRRRGSRRPVVLGHRLRRLLGAGPRETLGQALNRLPEAQQEVGGAAVRAYEALRFGQTGDVDRVRRCLSALAQVRGARSASLPSWIGPGPSSANSKS
ncbi:MAG: DUF3488 and transglutaminase-like domain-containing protein [Myxococcota bacterium]